MAYLRTDSTCTRSSQFKNEVMTERFLLHTQHRQTIYYILTLNFVYTHLSYSREEIHVFEITNFSGYFLVVTNRHNP